MKNYKLLTLSCLISCLALSGCSRYYLSICQQKINRDYLASTYVHTPDPRQENPPIGQMLTLSWQVPGKIMKRSPEVRLHLIFWDYTEQEIAFPMKHRIGYVNYKLLDDEFRQKKGILTYRAEIVTADGEVYKTWKHQLWVNLIQIEDECQPTENVEATSASAHSTSSSVDDQSKQGSVTETP
jgi:hypothetical protein